MLALVILSWYSYLIGDVKSTAVLRQQLVRCAEDLKLSQDPEPSLGIVRMEWYRRAYWVLYVTEQWFASCLGERLMPISYDCQWPQLEDSQLYAIDDLDNRIKLSDAVEHALQIHAFAEMIKLARILEVPSKAALTEWLLNLPSYLEYGKPTQVPSSVARTYHLLYYTVQILISHTSEQQHQLHHSTFITAANTIIHIAEQMLEDDQQKYLYNPFFMSLTLAVTIRTDHVLPHNEQARSSLDKDFRLLRKTNSSLVGSDDLERIVERLAHQRCGQCLAKEPEKKSRKRSIDEINSDNKTNNNSAATGPLLTTTNNHALSLPSFDLNDLFFLHQSFSSSLVLPTMRLPSPANSCDSFALAIDPSCPSDSSSSSYFSPTQSPTMLEEDKLVEFTWHDFFPQKDLINP
ncbi:hypothetical protein EC973_007493 [Apophysomyces ossiformis]|uniref:Xylanolytic transcriptional activator regulatory domain-containing protein n=1 Tax=Apophysomyces ossiformis TaxID=679940 RepID=A0A8H7EJN5_9FUNG|nr:hypothetical protein EC973_007493 [Apophysomyces ossiformis]